jgi:hypothetical protein
MIRRAGHARRIKLCPRVTRAQATRGVDDFYVPMGMTTSKIEPLESDLASLSLPP